MTMMWLRLSSKKGLRFLVAAALAFTLLFKILLYHRDSRQSMVSAGAYVPRTDQIRAFDSSRHPLPRRFPSVPPQTHSRPSPVPTKISQETDADPKASMEGAESELDCSNADGLQEIVYVIKTGVTEAMEKLPIHFNTTMKCFSNVLIFSDHAETIEGHIVHDALEGITEDLRLEHEDFGLWRRLHQHGRDTLRPEEMSDRLIFQDPDAGAGQGENSGWRLDRFKNFPMVGKTLALSKPEAKWFVFTDADTFVSWANVLHYTSLFDHRNPWYIGSPAQFADLLFNHGGSGYILSRPAMSQLAELYGHNQEYWDRYAASQPYGDAVLATALKINLNISCTWAFPQFQGGDPSVMDFSLDLYDRRLWCYPAISYHHLTPAIIQSLWQFEQRFHSTSTAEHGPMRHMHVFKQWAMLQMKTTRNDWDNGADVEVEDTYDGDLSRRVMGLPSCQAYCEARNCLLWSFIDDVCHTSTAYPKLGNKPTVGAVSGWRLDAIEAWADNLDGKCDGQWDWYIE